jgi:hypothetical protein
MRMGNPVVAVVLVAKLSLELFEQKFLAACVPFAPSFFGFKFG